MSYLSSTVHAVQPFTNERPKESSHKSISGGYTPLYSNAAFCEPISSASLVSIGTVSDMSRSECRLINCYSITEINDELPANDVFSSDGYKYAVTTSPNEWMSANNDTYITFT